MPLVLPVGTYSNGNPELLGSAFLAAMRGDIAYLVTALHVVKVQESLKLFIPPHQGNVNNFQEYPVLRFKYLEAQLAAADPITDLAVLKCSGLNPNVKIHPIINSPSELSAGEEMWVVGYPFAPIGSWLETVARTHITALGQRTVESVHVPEIILSYQAHSGSSGSPVIRVRDGVLCGVIRGSLAVPTVLRLGDLPIGTDSSVTYAVVASAITDLLGVATQS